MEESTIPDPKPGGGAEAGKEELILPLRGQGEDQELQV